MVIAQKITPPLPQHDEIDRLERLLQSKSSDLAILTEAAGVFHLHHHPHDQETITIFVTSVALTTNVTIVFQHTRR